MCSVTLHSPPPSTHIHLCPAPLIGTRQTEEEMREMREMRWILESFVNDLASKHYSPILPKTFSVCRHVLTQVATPNK